jgi:hypothetical protein
MDTMWLCIFIFKLFTAEGLAKLMLKVAKLVKIPIIITTTSSSSVQLLWAPMLIPLRYYPMDL